MTRSRWHHLGAYVLFAGTTVGLLVALGACQTRLPVTTPFHETQAPSNGLDPREEDPDALHAALFEEDCFPSARACARCHPDHFREWRVSPHAYAQLSPVFNAMHGTLVKQSNGTFGDFCIRCHTPVGMQRGEPHFASNLDRHPVSVEGVTCIVCHRVNQAYGKISGRHPIQTGDIFAPVRGPSGNRLLEEVLRDPEGTYGRIASDPEGTGSKIHADVDRFFHMTQPGFCGVCHDVTLGNGFRLEEAFSEYKHSPAAAKGQTCQDCHMGRVHGQPLGYDWAPAAEVNGEPTPARRRTNHMMPGPDHSIIHPGLFPHLGEKDLRVATMAQWLTFRHQDGWGRRDFEKRLRELPKDQRPSFPEPWDSARQRKKARRILDKQFELLAEYRQAQWEILRHGYQLGRVEVERCDADGVAFQIEVRNGTDGHNVPTGFIAERTLYLEVVVRDARGQVVFQSGDTDPNGDVRDLHSLYVHDGLMPQDHALFSLQSKFIVRMLRGGEREQVLATNHSVDPLPFLRPSTFSTILSGRPGGARIHRVGIEPNGRRWARYEVPRERLTGHAPYHVHARLISGMVPPNLIKEIQGVGFDYGMTPRQVADRIVAGRQVLWERSFTVAAPRR